MFSGSNIDGLSEVPAAMISVALPVARKDTAVQDSEPIQTPAEVSLDKRRSRQLRSRAQSTTMNSRNSKSGKGATGVLLGARSIRQGTAAVRRQGVRREGWRHSVLQVQRGGRAWCSKL